MLIDATSRYPALPYIEFNRLGDMPLPPGTASVSAAALDGAASIDMLSGMAPIVLNSSDISSRRALISRTGRF